MTTPNIAKSPAGGQTAAPQGSLKHAFDRFAQRFVTLDQGTLTWGSLALGAIILLCLNALSSALLKRAKVDLTQDGLFTISNGTRSILRAIDEPITVRLYFSKQLGEAAPGYAKYFDRVRALVEQYRDISGGKLQVQFLNPEAFSDAEDRAVAAGLNGVQLNREGDVGYFGLTATNSTDNDASIAFFNPERERFLEYDLTKLVNGLANPKKRVVGLITSLPVDGGMPPGGMMMGGGRPTPPWIVMEQIREFFEVKTLTPDVKSIPKDIDVLMLAQPEGLSDAALYAIDQYALGGGRILALVDPLAESARAGPMGPAPGSKTPALDKQLIAWGIKFDASKVAADIKNARRVQFGGAGRQPVITEYVAWIGLEKSALDDKDVLSGGIDKLNFATPGFLDKADGATTQFAAIVTTSPQSMVIDADRLRGMPPDAIGVLRTYKPGGKPLTLAARVSGPAKSSFAAGRPVTAANPAEDKKADTKPGDAKAADAKPAEPNPPHLAEGNINVIVIADTDLMQDQFWVEVREMFGQQMQIPQAQNAAFIVNALDNLSGGEAMIQLRGRGVDDRPFRMVDKIRLDSERRYRDKEQTLVAKLKDVQEQLSRIENKGEAGPTAGTAAAGQIILSDKDKRAIENFRREMLGIRGELRDVKLALKKDIDRLEGTLKFVNIAGVPLVLGLGGLLLAYRRRRKPPAADGTTTQPTRPSGRNP